MRRAAVLHPFLFALYPPVALLAVNAVWVPVGDSLRSMLASLALCAVLFAGLALLLRNPLKAGLITSLTLVPLYSYGQLYDGLRSAGIGDLTRHRYLVPVIAALVVLGIVAVVRTRRDLGPLTRTLNLIAALSLIMPLVSILRFQADRMFFASVSSADQPVPGAIWSGQEPPPDIYLIILDAYAREDVLYTVFNYENAATLAALRDLGFTVVEGGRANHAQTSLSLAALLNMEYVPELLPGVNPDSTNRDPLWELVQHSRVRRALRQLGYTTIAFASGLSGTEIRDADIYLAPGSADDAIGPGGLNAFETMLLGGSAWRLWTDFSIVLPGFLPNLDYPYRLHRERINYVFDELGELPRIPGPKFVFAHVIAPHPPFVFGPNGETVEQTEPFTLGFARSRISDGEYIGAYRDQIRYVDKRLLPAVAAILENSERPPIIIIQADHGPEGKHAAVSYPQERMTILNAIYLPDGGSEWLYDEITPVNTFRLIFQRYFQGEIDLLPDRVLFSQYRKPYDFIDLTDEIE